jgi:hypothetical protein
MAQYTCTCDRLAFPHRRARQCDEYAAEVREETEDAASDAAAMSRAMDRDEIDYCRSQGWTR